MFELHIIKDELPENPVIHSRLAVRGVIREGDKLLMVETNRGDYKFPGGGVEAGESEYEALLREIREETGYVDIAVGPCIGKVFEQNEDTMEPGSYFQMTSVYYICDLRSRKRASGVQDDYEEKLGFHGTFVTVEKAWERNRALLAGYELQEKQLLEEIPWLEREAKVLAELRRSGMEQAL